MLKSHSIDIKNTSQDNGSQSGFHYCGVCLLEFKGSKEKEYLCPICNHKLTTDSKIKNSARPCKIPLDENIMNMPPMLAFHKEKITKKNFEKWSKYSYAMQNFVQNSALSEKIMSNYNGAFRGFQLGLESYEIPGIQTYVVYLSKAKTPPENSLKMAADIVICMTATTARDINFVVHMGIFRSPIQSHLNILKNTENLALHGFNLSSIIETTEKQWRNDNKIKRVSKTLHKLSAKSLNEYVSNRKKEYVISAPLENMEKILTEIDDSTTVEITTEQKKMIITINRKDQTLDSNQKKWLDKLLFKGANPMTATRIDKL